MSFLYNKFAIHPFEVATDPMRHRLHKVMDVSVLGMQILMLVGLAFFDKPMLMIKTT